MESAAPPPAAPAAQSPPAGDRPLRVSEAAWLTRTNDDTVRRWLRDSSYPRRSTAAGELATTWQELNDYCAEHGRAEPLPPDLLTLDPISARSVLGDATHTGTAADERLGSEPVLEPNVGGWATTWTSEAETTEAALDTRHTVPRGTASGHPAAPEPADRPTAPSGDLESVDGLRAELRDRDAQLAAATRRATLLRRMLREKIAGSTHARSDAAASDRAISMFLDADEAGDA